MEDSAALKLAAAEAEIARLRSLLDAADMLLREFAPDLYRALVNLANNADPSRALTRALVVEGGK